MKLAGYLLMISTTAFGADFLSSEISNGIVTMQFYVQQERAGSYRGTRFDWSGIAHSIKYAGHEFAGQWYPKHDPQIHDALTGPAEEFLMGESAHGYAEAQPGGTFMRIGVGTVRKPAGETAYNRFKTYEIVDPGRRSFEKTEDKAVFVHELDAGDGYAYRYTKTVRLTKGKPEFTIEHRLENTGRKAIEFDQYNHNFFTIDDSTIGPGVSITFPFAPKAKEDLGGKAVIKGNSIEFLRDLAPGGEYVGTAIEGFGSTERDYDFRIDNKRAGAGVRIRGDQPLTRIYFWSIRTVACPEPFIHLRAEPGKDVRWTLTYDLNTIAR